MKWQKTPEALAALTPEQFHVTQHSGTERPGTGALLHEHRRGLYVDVVSGEPLFTSLDKFPSHCGWPSFRRPAEPANIVEHPDHTFGMQRTEVRSKYAGSHLGHVFDDGPRESGGLRYCINSAALRFVPLADLEKEGYAEYRQRFADKGSQ